jgi:serine/threonine-protein kinase
MSRSASSTPPLAAGRTIGDRFEIWGVLGEGGTGVVYDAVRLPDRQPIALKVIHHHLLSDAQIRGRFAREAAILRRLEGPHLCPILEFGELPDPRNPAVNLLFMALPKIDGPALETVLKTDVPLPIDGALELMLQVLSGLKAAHLQAVIHRDLKPANVILRGGTHAIVVDFGMAKIVTGGGTGTTVLTTHNMVFGTPEYMSPEQARGDELDARCDVYAAGIILYQLVTGGVPFAGSSPLNVLTAHLTLAPEPPRLRAPHRAISPALEAVILHAIAKDPADRYASAAALAAAIVQARQAPDDAAAVHPQAFSPTGKNEMDEAHAPTLPAIPSSPLERRLKPTDVSTVPPAPAPASMGLRGWAIVAIFAALGIGIGVLLSFFGN